MAQIQTNEAKCQVDGEKRPSLLVSALSSWVALVVNVVIGLLLTPYIISKVNKDGYGIWSLVISFIGYFGLLQLGVGAAVMRYLPFYEGRNDYKKMNGVITTALSMYLVVALIIFIVSFFFSGFIADFFKEGSTFRLMVRLVGTATAVSCPAAVLDAAIRAREKFAAANFLAVVMALMRAVCLVTVLHIGYGLEGMGWVTVILGFVEFGLTVLILIRVCPNIKFSYDVIRFSHLTSLLSFGIMANLMSFGFMLRFQSDRVIIGKFISMEAVGVYAVAATLMLYYRNCVGATGRVLMPRFGYLDGRGLRTETTALFIKSTKIVAVVAAGTAGLIIAIGPCFVKLWVGGGFKAVYSVLFVLALAQMIDQSQTPSIALLSGLGKQGVLAAFAIAEGAVAVILSIILIPKYSLMGVAIGLAIPMIITQILLRPAYICRLLSIGLADYYKKCLLKTWLLVVILFLPMRLMRLEERIDSWLSFVPTATILGSVYLVATYFFVFNPKERLFLSQKIWKTVTIEAFFGRRFQSGTFL